MCSTEPSKAYTFSIKIIEARINKSVAALGSMSPYCKIIYGHQSYTSSTQHNAHMHPAWNECVTFELAESPFLDIFVIHKTMIFSDKEVGSCRILLSEIYKGKMLDWWPLHDGNMVVGSILANLSFDEKECSIRSTHHTSNNSLDIRDEYIKRLNDLELEREEIEYYKQKYKCKIEKLNQEKRRCRTVIQEWRQPSDFSDSFSVVSECISKENAYEIEKQNLYKEKNSLQRKKANLLRKEDELKIEREKIILERDRLKGDRLKIEQLRNIVKGEFKKLKQKREKAEFKTLQNTDRSLEDEISELDQIRKTLFDKQQILSNQFVKIDQDKNQLLQEKERFEEEKRRFYDAVQSNLGTGRKSFCNIPKSPNSVAIRSNVHVEISSRLINF